MRYVSLFSGIEAASVAWKPLGWEPAAFSEIERFPCDLLEKRFPDVPNLGDVTTIDWRGYAGKAGLVIGGSPCQSFSVAGLRKGLADPRGNLMLEYLRAVARIEPKWVLWENVPGVLSVDGGRAFGTLLGALAQLGYGFAYRVLDAQFYGVAQRRRRVFVVGCSGGRWQRAAAVLFDGESLSGNTRTGREKRAELAGRAACSAAAAGVPGRDPGAVSAYSIAANTIDRQPKNGAGGLGVSEDISFTPTTADKHAVLAFSHNASGTRGFAVTEDLAPTLRSCCPSNIPAAVSIDCRNLAFNDEVSGTLQAKGTGGYSLNCQNPVMRLPDCNSNAAVDEGLAGTLKVGGGAPAVLDDQGGGRMSAGYGIVGTLRAQVHGNVPAVLAPAPSGRPAQQRIRRLMPIECERLQGFPDGWTDIYEKTPDGPRYKALGNSMAVPVIEWLGERIRAVEEVRL